MRGGRAGTDHARGSGHAGRSACDRCPATMLMMVEGTKNGEILRGLLPASRKVLCSSWMRSRPPMPEPMITPSAIEIQPAQVEARIRHRIHARGDAVVHELVHAPRILRGEVFLELEILHRAAEAAREILGIEARDRPDAAHTADDIGPGAVDGAAHRRDDTQPRDDYATLAQKGSSGRLRETVPVDPAGARRVSAAHAVLRRTIRPWRADR